MIELNAKVRALLNNKDIGFQDNAERHILEWQKVSSIIDAMHQHQLSQKPKFDKKGKLLPRARIQALLDPGSFFLELCTIAGFEMYGDKDGSQAGGGIIAGIGQVAGTQCMIVASNSALKGGTISPIGLKKSLRLQNIALKQKLPIITLAESGGADLHHASDIFVEGATSFANQSRLSAAGIPQITIVHGNATAGGAYQPALSDYVILVRQQSQMYLAGPPLVLAAIGETVDDETLGGSELHASTTGSGDFLAENDLDAITKARHIVELLNWHNVSIPTSYVEPRTPTEEVIGVVPHDPKKPYQVQEIITRLVDNSDALEFKQEYDQHTLCSFANIGGVTCGIIGNNGPITAAGAAKAAHFIQLCEQTSRSLVFLHNTTGFMVGSESERNGVIKQGAKLIQAVTNASVPKISIVIGGSYGAGNYAMCGRGIDPDFIFAWPTSRTSVMGGDQAGKVVKIVSEQSQKRKGIEPDQKMLDFLESSTKAKFDKESTAAYGSARLWDDGIIEPTQTRAVLIYVLHLCRNALSLTLKKNQFGIPRH